MSKVANGLKKLIAEVEIEDVRLVEANVATKVRSPSGAGAVDLLVNRTAEISEHQEENGTFFVVATMRAQLVPEQAAEEPLVSIETKFELQYRLPEGFHVDSQTLTAFAETNGIYNAWPYWREFVQSMFVRMGLPPLALPLLRAREMMGKTRESRAIEGAAEAST